MIGIVGAVQFVNILDFMIVMPLGPDFATALNIPQSQLGAGGGSYTAAAAVSGVAAAFFLDRFDRRNALCLAMLGLVLGTAAGALASDLWTLLLARVLAGTFGGPATSISLAIIADLIPPERRGRAMGAVMGSFSAASVLGVPAGLEVARLGGWRAPFLAVAGLGLVVVTLAYWQLPPLRLHLTQTRAPPSLLRVLRRPLHVMSYGMLALMTGSGFLLIPNLSPFFQHNLGYPRERLGLLYLVGGVLSFFWMRLAGRLVDRLGATRVGVLGGVAFCIVIVVGFGFEHTPAPVLLIFVAFMLSQNTRMVAQTALITRVPPIHERAAFSSLQSAVQHASAALGALASSRMLVDGPNQTLVGMPRLVVTGVVLTLLAFPLLWRVERGVRSSAG